jgi:carboxymethylenebutenolidase
MSNGDHGAAAAAIDAMDAMAVDPRPDTEAHLRWNPAQAATAEDSTRADLLLIAMRAALLKYADVRVARGDGFIELPGRAKTHAMHHLSNWAWARAEARRFDPAKPASLLYREKADGTLALVGAMYTAPASATPAELDRRVPVGVAHWHQHADWCTPPTGSAAQWLATQNGLPLYGPRSPITTRGACEATGGAFYPRVYGWMVHVTLVGSDDPTVVWGGGLETGADSSPPPHDTTAAVVPTATPAPPPPPPAPSPAQSPTAFASAPVAVAPASARPRAHPPEPANPVSAPSSAVAMSGRFPSGLSTVTYERYRPLTRGRHPAVLVLHDAGGPEPQAPALRQLAEGLTRRGYVVEMVHYFDRTGTATAGPEERRKQFRQWIAAMHDALDDIAGAPDVDRDKLGIFGTGLGATLALMTAAEEPRVKAVAEYAGSFPARAAPLVRRLPPVMIAQGNQDRAVPLIEAYRIRALCQAVQAPFEFDVMPGQEHAFRGPVADEVRRKTIAFFDRYLSGAS